MYVPLYGGEREVLHMMYGMGRGYVCVGTAQDRHDEYGSYWPPPAIIHQEESPNIEGYIYMCAVQRIDGG